MTTDTNPSRHSVSIGLAFVSGAGFFLMLLAIVSGVVSGASADASNLGLLFIAGLALFVVGLIAWYAVAQPPAHFDDINEPQYFGHNHEESAHSETSEHH